jgi:hypothetical protein
VRGRAAGAIDRSPAEVRGGEMAEDRDQQWPATWSRLGAARIYKYSYSLQLYGKWLCFLTRTQYSGTAAHGVLRTPYLSTYLLLEYYTKFSSSNMIRMILTLLNLVLNLVPCMMVICMVI